MAPQERPSASSLMAVKTNGSDRASSDRSSQGSKQSSTKSSKKSFGSLFRGRGRKKGAADDASVTSSMSFADLDSSETFSVPPPPSSPRNSPRTPNALRKILVDDAISVSMRTPSSPTKKHISPQQYLISTIKLRGYSTTIHNALQTGYYCRPTPYQLASFGDYVVTLLMENDLDRLENLLEAGLHAGACNEEGVTLMHLACRYGLEACVQILLRHGATFQVSDEDGRTPLHEVALVEPNTKIIDLILKENPRLMFLADKEGNVPLALVEQDEKWTSWTKYLMNRKNKIWPDLMDSTGKGFEGEDPLAMEKPHSRPIPDPRGFNLSLMQVSQLAMGEIEPFELAREQQSQKSEPPAAEESLVSQYKQAKRSDGKVEKEEDDAQSHDTFDFDEMNEILGNLQGTGAQVASA